MTTITFIKINNEFDKKELINFAIEHELEYSVSGQDSIFGCGEWDVSLKMNDFSIITNEENEKYSTMRLYAEKVTSFPNYIKKAYYICTDCFERLEIK